MDLLLIHGDRLSTIVNADIILVIQNGSVVDQGTHHQLLKKGGGLYFELWNKQLEEKKVDVENKK